MKKVIFMHEGAGVYTKGFKNKKEAVEAMRNEAEREKFCDVMYWVDYFGFEPDDITDETVRETRYRQHRACESETIGEDDCCHECMEPCGTGGRLTFAFFA